jgi:hypothetical protein
MDETPGDSTEALFMVVASLVRTLRERGVLSADDLEAMQLAFNLQAEKTRHPQYRADLSLAAEYAEVLVIAEAVEQSPKHPGLRLVRDDDES